MSLAGTIYYKRSGTRVRRDSRIITTTIDIKFIFEMSFTKLILYRRTTVLGEYCFFKLNFAHESEKQEREKVFKLSVNVAALPSGVHNRRLFTN